MKGLWGAVSVQVLLRTLAATGLACLIAAGCGGTSANPFSSGGGAGGTAGETAQGGSHEAGKGAGGASHAGAPNTGDAGEGGDAAQGGEGGEAGEAPAKSHSAAAFVSAAAVSKSKHFILIGALGESLGGTASSKQSKSKKYVYVPGVIGATSP